MPRKTGKGGVGSRRTHSPISNDNRSPVERNAVAGHPASTPVLTTTESDLAEGRESRPRLALRNRIWLTLLRKVRTLAQALSQEHAVREPVQEALFAPTGHDAHADFLYVCESKRNTKQRMAKVDTEKFDGDIGHIECIAELRPKRDGSTVMRYFRRIQDALGSNTVIHPLINVTGDRRPAVSEIPVGGKIGGVQLKVRVVFPRDCSSKGLSQEDQNSLYGAIATLLLKDGVTESNGFALHWQLAKASKFEYSHTVDSVLRDIRTEYPDIHELLIKCDEYMLREDEIMSANQAAGVLSVDTEEQQHEEFKRILHKNVQTLKDRMWRSPAYHVGRLDANAEARAEGQVIERVHALVTILAANDVDLSPEEVEWLETLPLKRLPELNVAQSSRTNEAFWRDAGLNPNGS